MTKRIEITYFYTGERANVCHYSDLETAQKNAAYHVGPRPEFGGSGLSGLYAYNPGTAYSLRANGVTLGQLFPALATKEVAE